MSFLGYSKKVAGLLAITAVMSPVVAAGQVLTTLEFSLSNPGARSMGFGGAFVALADDATAAFANPAGLTQLSQPEISIEGRSWSFTTPYTHGGRAAGEPTGLGIDTEPGVVTADSTADLTGLSFASFVYPRKRWSLAIFQHQLMNFEMTQEIQGLFAPGFVVAGSERGPIERAFFDLEIVTRGVAVAFQVSDKLHLGFGVSYFNPKISVQGWEYVPDDDTVESYFAEASFLSDRLLETVSAQGDEGDWGFSGGFLWAVTDRWRLGGVYRRGPEFTLGVRAEVGPAHPFFPAGFTEEATLAPWQFPDVYGLGISFRSANDRVTVAFEWDRVEYSTITDSLDPLVKAPGDTMDDGDELHLGGEYAFLGSTPLFAVRAGLWRDPDHRVRNDTDGPFFQAEARGGEDELHYAAGLGVVFKHFQIDAGVDLSELVDTVSLSAIYTF